MGSDRLCDPTGMENICIWATHCTLDLDLGARGFRTGALPCFDVPLRVAGFLLDIVMLSKTLVVRGWPAGELEDFPAPDTCKFKCIFFIFCKCISRKSLLNFINNIQVLPWKGSHVLLCSLWHTSTIFIVTRHSTFMAAHLCHSKGI